MAALGVRRWGRQQPPQPQIDWSHPLAQGLKVCLWATGNGKPVDLVSGKMATLTGPGQATTDIGLAQKLDGSTSGFNLPVDLSGTNKVTLSTWLRPEVETAVQIIAELTANANTSEGFLITWANSNASNWAVGKWFTATMHTNTGPSATAFGTPDPSTNRLHHMVTKLDRSATSTQVYVDGVAQPMTANGTTANTAMTGNFPNDTLYVGARAGTSLFLQGRMPLLMIHTRILSDSEILRLYTEPYGLFNPQSPRQRYWLPAASTVLASVSIPTTATASASPAITVTSAPTVTLTTPGSTSAAPAPSIAPVQSTVSLTTAATATAAPTLTVTPADQVGPNTTATTTTAPAPSVTAAATVSLPGVATTTSAPTRTLPVTVVIVLTTAATATASPVIAVTGVGPTVPAVKGWSRGGIGRAARTSGSPTRVAAMRGTPVRTGSSTGGLS